MIAYMVRNKETKQWLLNKFKRKGPSRRFQPILWTDDAKGAEIWLRKNTAIQTMRANRINKESEIVEFELQEL